MNNPFDLIDARLSNIETLLLDIKHQKPTEKADIISDSLTKDQALHFLKENGLPMKTGQFYSLTSTGKIPAKRIGKRLVLSRNDLKNWLASKTVEKPSPTKEAAKILAESANKKLERAML